MCGCEFVQPSSRGDRREGNRSPEASPEDFSLLSCSRAAPTLQAGCLRYVPVAQREEKILPLPSGARRRLCAVIPEPWANPTCLETLKGHRGNSAPVALFSPRPLLTQRCRLQLRCFQLWLRCAWCLGEYLVFFFLIKAIKLLQSNTRWIY